jgi:ubiquinone/menaquinone biosynthesis C-methylase UbiE
MNVKRYWEAEAEKAWHVSAEEDLFVDYWSKRYLDSLVNLRNGKRILDIGCGDAKYFIKLAPKYSQFYGVELSNQHFKFSKRIFNKGEYVMADGNHLPFQDCSFDAIMSFGAFEHNEDIDTIFGECYRVLNNNGILVFSIPNYLSTYFPYIYILKCLIKNEDRIISIGHYYSKNGIINRLKDHGFGNIAIIDSIYASPAPIIELFYASVSKFIKAINLTIDTSRIKYFKYKSIFYFNGLFYPLERAGFGFMTVYYCEKLK